MNFYGDKSILKVNLLDPGGQHKFIHFFEQAGADFTTHVGEIYC
jgi:hypothetical protein